MTRVFHMIRNHSMIAVLLSKFDKDEISFYRLSTRARFTSHQDNCFHSSNCGCLICYNQCECRDSSSILTFWQCWLWQRRVWHCHSAMKSCSSSRGEEPAVRFGFLVFIQGWALTGSPGCRDKQPVVPTPGRGQEPENGRAEPSLSTRACLVSA